MRHIKQTKTYIIELSEHELESLLTVCNSATLRYREQKMKAMQDIAEELWDTLYAIQKEG